MLFRSGAPELTPRLVLEGTNYSKVAAGQNHTCGIRTGRLYCWGWGALGQLGNGGQTNLGAPTEVQHLLFFESGAEDVMAGNGHTCARAGRDPGGTSIGRPTSWLYLQHRAIPVLPPASSRSPHRG